MLRWAIVFLLIALIASFFGFVNIEGTALLIGRILLFVFLIICVIALVSGRKPTV